MVDWYFQVSNVGSCRSWYASSISALPSSNVIQLAIAAGGATWIWFVFMAMSPRADGSGEGAPVLGSSVILPWSLSPAAYTATNQTWSASAIHGQSAWPKRALHIFVITAYQPVGKKQYSNVIISNPELVLYALIRHASILRTIGMLHHRYPVCAAIDVLIPESA